MPLSHYSSQPLQWRRMGAMVSEFTGTSIACSTVCLGWHNRKYVRPRYWPFDGGNPLSQRACSNAEKVSAVRVNYRWTFNSASLKISTIPKLNSVDDRVEMFFSTKNLVFLFKFVISIGPYKGMAPNKTHEWTCKMHDWKCHEYPSLEHLMAQLLGVFPWKGFGYFLVGLKFEWVCRIKNKLETSFILLHLWYPLESNLCKHAGGHSVTIEAWTSLARVCVVWNSGSSLELSALVWSLSF